MDLKSATDLVAQKIAAGESLPQRYVDVAEFDVRRLVPPYALNLGHNPPCDPAVIKLLPGIVADPIWDRLPADADAFDFWDILDGLK